MPSWLERRWYSDQPAPLLLKPLAALYGRVAALRRHRYQFAGNIWQAPVPVIVVGNISIGGTGKTPLTQSLCAWLMDQGWRPGIISRGYGSHSDHYPRVVAADDDPVACGDEPLLLAQTTGCPVVIDPDRRAAAKRLLTNFDCDLIISDDGLQHYALGRDIEIAVIDGERGLGNGALLPAGPLREPEQRLQTTDLVVINGGEWQYPGAHRMRLETDQIRHLSGKMAELPSGPVHAVAGIGNPQRFFNALTELGYEPIAHPLPDHHPITDNQLQFNDDLPVIMTAKDAVKCRAFAPHNRYYLPVKAVLPPAFYQALQEKLPSRAE